MRGSVTPDDPFEAFVDLWRELRADSAEPGTVILVEGERDRRALRRLGIPGPVVAVHRGQSLAGSAQALVGSSRRVILLTDWDTEGGHFAQRFRDLLSAEPARLDLEYRRRLARILRGELVHVEGLHGWARRQAERRRRSLETLVDGDEPRATG
ncbi:MAG TPA: toprim domain-containing protein [Thermoplasmata archaeon]|nr:toprim domain-containing protein [Thermoplasmata archaeon]